MSMTREEAVRFAHHAYDMTDIPDVKEFYAIAEKALREQEERRWIPVTERLPEDNIPSTAYLCWWRGHTHICKYWRTRKCFEFNGRVVNVTHWMPLPEPPKEDE